MQKAVNSAASDPTTFDAFSKNKTVCKFFATLKRSTRQTITALGNQATAASETKVIRGVAESFSLAKKAFIELLQCIWDLISDKTAEVLESIGSTMRSKYEQMEERLQSFIILLLGIFKRSLDRSMYDALSYLQ